MMNRMRLCISFLVVLVVASCFMHLVPLGFRVRNYNLQLNFNTNDL